MVKGAEVWVSVCADETRVVLLDGGDVREIHIQRGAEATLVGNIYSARVVRVMPDLGAAFIDFGGERHGFLALADLASAQPRLNKGGAIKAAKAATIADFIHEGQKLLVQVIKDPVASKGARLTTQLSLSSRYIAFSPDSSGIGVSRNIKDPQERDRLRQLVLDASQSESVAPEMAGFILRTAADGVSAQHITADLHFISGLWAAITQRAKLATGVTAIYTDLPIPLRVLRDVSPAYTEQIRIDCRQTYATLAAYCQAYCPELSAKLRCEERGLLASEEQLIGAEIARALARRVALAGGGYLIIDQTEALTVIDVNSGSAVAAGADRALSYAVNKEAAKVLTQQLRLRDTGGIVIVDFIDMPSKKQQRDLLSYLRQCTVPDSAIGKISEMSRLGLVEFTRKRSRRSLAQVLCEDCSTCKGGGRVRSAATISLDILRRLHRLENDSVVVRASSAVVDWLEKEYADELLSLRSHGARQIDLQRLSGRDPELFELAVF